MRALPYIDKAIETISAGCHCSFCLFALPYNIRSILLWNTKIVCLTALHLPANYVRTTKIS